MPNLGAMPQLNDYSLCNMTVTVYRYDNGNVSRRVCRHVYFEDKQLTLTQERTGDAEKSSFLLVIPSDRKAVNVGDKVFVGVGPQVPAEDVAQWWRAFIPSKVDGLVVVRNVALRRWNGVVVHTEAGG